MLQPMYSVFYNAGAQSFFQSRTDFPSQKLAEEFLNSRLFIFDGYHFDFMLKNGKELIQGKPKENTAKYFQAAMKFAVEIPITAYNQQLRLN